MSSEDLHSHSLASDGTLSPADLVRLAAARAVQYLALTDHDTTAGLAEAQAAAQTEGIQLVPGVEISTQWCGISVHVLGLGVDWEHPELRRLLAANQEARDRRAEEMGRRLEKAGLQDATARARDLAGGDIVTRTHYARLLVADGMAKDFAKAIHKWLKPGKKGYVTAEWTSVARAVTAITAAGGFAVLAHPARYGLSATKLRALAGDFKEAGGAALEVVSGGAGTEEIHKLGALALRYELRATRGSDFHTPDYTWRQLGALARLPDKTEPLLPLLIGAEN